MRIAVVGTGGVGGGFGAALAHAGADVTFIARGAHLAAMQSEGLKVQGGRGESHLVPTKATDDPARVGPVDIVLFCVKLWDVESAGQHIKPMVGPDTAVIPLQNGIDAPDRLIPILGPVRSLGAAGPKSSRKSAVPKRWPLSPSPMPSACPTRPGPEAMAGDWLRRCIICGTPTSGRIARMRTASPVRPTTFRQRWQP